MRNERALGITFMFAGGAWGIVGCIRSFFMDFSTLESTNAILCMLLGCVMMWFGWWVNRKVG